jgi:PKD repeat protein
MKKFNINISLMKSSLVAVMFAMGLFFLNACSEDKIPGAGEIEDSTPPSAGFSFSGSPTDPKEIKFSNLSASATDFSWDFGDGNTSNEKEPSNTFADFGKYVVTLIASDKLGVSSTITQDVNVVEGPYQPFILEFGFEDGQLSGGIGDGRDSWRNSDLGGVIQITGSPVRTGDQGAKMPGVVSDQRIGYQLITVEAESNYDLNFYYTLLDDQIGSLTVSVLSGPVTTHDDAIAATIGSVTVNDQTDPSTFESASVSFNSGTSTQVAIYFFNGGTVEARLDDFSIDIAPEGAVPPSASFTSEQSAANYLEYVFTNGSVNAASYEWDFGDGNTSTDVSPTHVYTEAKIYTIKLVAKSETGLTGEFSADLDIQAPVTAEFTHVVDADSYNKFHFTDASVGAVNWMWDFGDGYTATLQNPSHTYDVDGSYTVKLTASSVTGFTSEATAVVAVSAGAIIPLITNGDFDASSSGWKPSSCTDCSTSAFNGSSDGSWYDYAGVLGTVKTKGAKYTATTSTNPDGSPQSTGSTRYAYQALNVTPNTTYVLEYEYTIKADVATDPEGGRRVIAEILDGHFADAAVAAASTTLVTSIGTVAEGKFSATVGQKVTAEFTSNASGEIAIFLSAVTPVDAWFDNIKVYPKD